MKLDTKNKNKDQEIWKKLLKYCVIEDLTKKIVTFLLLMFFIIYKKIIPEYKTIH